MSTPTSERSAAAFASVRLVTVMPSVGGAALHQPGEDRAPHRTGSEDGDTGEMVLTLRV